ncbi:MAG: hypothetical protein JXB04_09015 [Kiritimatiellae bacterium]|nr:hypothetical protein [Kiritimatiellia bacterium]
MQPEHQFYRVPADHPLYLLLAEVAAERDVAIDMHMEAVVKSRPMPDNLRRASPRNPATLQATVAEMENLLVHERGARIVWQQAGWDNTGEFGVDLIRRLLAAHPNLYFALRVEGRPYQVGGGRLL